MVSHLSDLYGPRFTLVYFYPKADTPGCTAEACSLRDGFTELQARGIKDHRRQHGRPRGADALQGQATICRSRCWPITERVAAKAFGVPLMLGMTHRQSFLIRNRRIIWRDLHASTREQARDVLKALENLAL